MMATPQNLVIFWQPPPSTKERDKKLASQIRRFLNDLDHIEYFHDLRLAYLKLNDRQVCDQFLNLAFHNEKFSSNNTLRIPVNLYNSSLDQSDKGFRISMRLPMHPIFAAHLPEDVTIGMEAFCFTKDRKKSSYIDYSWDDEEEDNKNVELVDKVHALFVPDKIFKINGEATPMKFEAQYMVRFQRLFNHNDYKYPANPTGQADLHFNHELLSQLTQVSQEISARFTQWVEYLDFKDNLIKLKTTGLRYLGWEFLPEGNSMQFLVVAQNQAELDFAYNTFRRQNLLLFTPDSSTEIMRFVAPEAKNKKDARPEIRSAFNGLAQLSNRGYLKEENFTEQSKRIHPDLLNLYQVCRNLKAHDPKHFFKLYAKTFNPHLHVDQDARESKEHKESRESKNNFERRRWYKDFDFSAWLRSQTTTNHSNFTFGILEVDLSEDIVNILEDLNDPSSYHGFRNIPELGFIAISLIGDLSLTQRHRRIIKNLTKGHDIYAPYLTHYLFDISNARLPHKFPEIKQWYNSNLNQQQRRAVQKMLAAPDICLIQGPPGTGKTTVIAEAILQMVSRGERILLSSQSHDAIDNALSRVLAHPSLRAIRLARDERKITDLAAEFTSANSLGTYYTALNSYFQDNYTGVREREQLKIQEIKTLSEQLQRNFTTRATNSDKISQLQEQLHALQATGSLLTTKYQQARQELEQAQLLRNNLQLAQGFLAGQNEGLDPHFLRNPAYLRPYLIKVLEIMQQLQLKIAKPTLTQYEQATPEQRFQFMKGAVQITRNLITVYQQLLQVRTANANRTQARAAYQQQIQEVQQRLEQLTANIDTADLQELPRLQAQLQKLRNLQATDGINFSCLAIFAHAPQPQQATPAQIEQFINEVAPRIYNFLTSIKQEIANLGNNLPPTQELEAQTAAYHEQLQKQQQRLQREQENLQQLETTQQQLETEYTQGCTQATSLPDYGKQVRPSTPAPTTTNGFSQEFYECFNWEDDSLANFGAENQQPFLTEAQLQNVWNQSSQSNVGDTQLQEITHNLDQLQLFRAEQSHEFNVNHRHELAIGSIFQEILARPEDRAAQDWDQVKEAYIENANLVAISCNESDATYNNNNLSGFDVVIIDEVSKATPLELLLPLTRARRAILVGDHCQLPPVFSDNGIDVASLEEAYLTTNEEGEEQLTAPTQNNIPEHARLSKDNLTKYERLYSASLFKELFEQAPEQLKEQLQVQFRMHPAIMDVINNFYHGTLKCGNPHAPRPHALSLKLGDKDVIGANTHIAWIDTTTDEQNASYRAEANNVNRVEARLIARTLLHLDKTLAQQAQQVGANKSAPQEKLDVGVVSFYQPQCRAIRQEIHKLKHQFKHIRIDVNSVIRYQGKEKPLILVSLVKNNGGPPTQRVYGSNANIARFEFINVAMSRAQNFLMVFGAKNMLNNREVKLPPRPEDGIAQPTKVYRKIFDYLSSSAAACALDSHTLSTLLEQQSYDS